MKTVKNDITSKAVRGFLKILLLGSVLAPIPASHANAASQTSLQIGDHFGGGKIAHILKPGDRGYVAGQTHGLIAAREDLGTAKTWKHAVLSCRNYHAGNHRDWRLPKKDELRRLYENRFVIGGFKNNHYYWSGTESDSDDAWDISIRTGKRSLAYKRDYNYIRPVRIF